MAQKKEQWATRLGVIMAVAGSAVGLGNFLRFPGQAAQNGGGVFMIPYFCALIFLGIPICWAEWAMGKYGGQCGFNSSPAIFGVLGRKPIWRYFGVVGVLVPVCVYFYYIVIESWCLGYAWSYLTGSIDLGSDPTKYVESSKSFYANYVGSAADGSLIGLNITMLFLVITFAANFYLIYRGLSKGIETFCNWAIPVMAVFAIIVLVRVLTLDAPLADHPEQNVLNGLGFMWNPKPKHVGESWLAVLANPQVWLAAAGQIFFTLSVGFGVIINYASYLKRNDDIVLSGLTASATNEFFEVCLGGLITIPAAFIFLGAIGVQDSLGSSFDLGFKTLPVVFEYMPAGRLFGFLWFFMLFLAAITSSLSMLQPAIAFLEEGLNIGRHASCALLGIVTGTGALFVVYFSKGLTALDTIDFWVGTAMLFVLATIEVILFSWVFGADRGIAFARIGAELPLPRLFRFVIRYVSPAYLLIVFAMWCYKNLPGYAQQLRQGGVPLFSVLVIAVSFVFLLILTNIAGKRWKAETKDTSALDKAISQAGFIQ
jgi:SNF family Na+-dependent transporter